MNARLIVLLGACIVVVAVAFFGRSPGTPSQGNPGTGRPASRTPASPGASPAPGAAAHSGFDNFKLIHTRNVFDPDRRPVRTGPAPATPAPTRTDYVALTGTFFDGDAKQLAFFSGTRPEYNKVLSVRDQIAGATINKISGSGIEVVRNGHTTAVGVGQTVPFDNSAPAAAPNPSPANGDVVPGAVAASPNGPTSGKQDEVRRRMEERRRQEQK